MSKYVHKIKPYLPDKIKKTAIKKINNKDKTVTDISRELKVTRTTVYNWIKKENQRVIELKPDDKIKLWQREACKDLHLAALARESLREMMETNSDEIKPDTKRAIMHSASVTAGIKWDKSRMEAGQGVTGDIHQIMINVFNRRSEGVVPLPVSEMSLTGDNEVSDVVSGGNNEE